MLVQVQDIVVSLPFLLWPIYWRIIIDEGVNISYSSTRITEVDLEKEDLNRKNNMLKDERK